VPKKIGVPLMYRKHKPDKIEDIQSTADKLLAQAKQREDDQAKLEKDMLLIRRDLDAVFKTESGIRVARIMMRLSGIYNSKKNTTDPVLMGEQRGLAKMYLLLIKGSLKSELVAKIERNPTKEEED